MVLREPLVKLALLVLWEQRVPQAQPVHKARLDLLEQQVKPEQRAQPVLLVQMELTERMAKTLW
jgi:hypothetical protein